MTDCQHDETEIHDVNGRVVLACSDCLLVLATDLALFEKF